VFNVADVAIVGGVAVLAIWIMFPTEEEPETAEDDGVPKGDASAETGALS
jgi:hypothetical protein